MSLLPPTQSLLKTFWTAQCAGFLVLVSLSFFPALFHLEEHIFFVFLFLALIVAWREKRNIWIHTPVNLPFLLLLGWVLLTVPFATDPWYSFAEWRKLATQALVLYWSLLVFRSAGIESVRHWVVPVIVFSTASISIFAVYDFASRGGSWTEYMIQARAPSSSGSWLSSYLVITIPLLVSGMFVVPHVWERVVLISVLGLSLLGVFSAYTRAGWVALFIQTIAYGLSTGRRRLLAGVLSAGCMISLALLWAFQAGYHRATLSLGTFYQRVAVWEMGLRSIGQHPFMGVGFGDYTFSYPIKGFAENDLVLGLHNTFLIFAVGSGIPALIFFMWALIIAGIRLIRQFKSSGDRLEKELSIGIAMALVGFVVQNCFAYLFAGSLAYLFWMLVGLGLGGAFQDRRRMACSPRTS